MTLHPVDRPGVVIHGPTAQSLRAAWALAHAKVERRLGRPPVTLAECNAVTIEYGRLARKNQGIPVPCPPTERSR